MTTNRISHFLFFFLQYFTLCSQIKQYYQFKVKHSSIYNGLSPNNEKNIFDHDILHVLPKRDQLGRRILVIELGSELHIIKYNSVVVIKLSRR